MTRLATRMRSAGRRRRTVHPVQTQKNTGTTSGLTQTVTLDQPSRGGNTIVVLIAIPASSNSVTEVNDDVGNGYSLAAEGHLSGVNTRAEVWYADDAIAGAVVVTATLNSSMSAGMQVVEYAGVLTGGPPLRDAQGLGTATNTSIPTASVTAAPGDLVIGLLSSPANTSYAVSSGFSPLPFFAGSSQRGRAAYTVASAAGAQQATWTLGTASNAGTVAALFIKQGASVPDPPPDPPPPDPPADPTLLWDPTNLPPSTAALLARSRQFVVADWLEDTFGVTAAGSGPYVGQWVVDERLFRSGDTSQGEGVWIKRSDIITRCGGIDDVTLDFRRVVVLVHGGRASPSYALTKLKDPVRICYDTGDNHTSKPKRLAVVFSTTSTPPAQVGRIIAPTSHNSDVCEQVAWTWEQSKYNLASPSYPVPALRQPASDGLSGDNLQVWAQSAIVVGLRSHGGNDAVMIRAGVTNGGPTYTFFRGCLISQCRDDIFECDNGDGTSRGGPVYVDGLKAETFMGYSYSPGGTVTDRSAARYTNYWRNSLIDLKAFGFAPVDRLPLRLNGSQAASIDVSSWDEGGGAQSVAYGHGGFFKQAGGTKHRTNLFNTIIKQERYAIGSYPADMNPNALGNPTGSVGDSASVILWNNGDGNPDGLTAWPFTDAPMPAGMANSQVKAPGAHGTYEADFNSSFLTTYPQFVGL